jgi:hypothetical protein
LARRTQESLVDIHLDPGLHEACSVDIQRLCKDTPPGQSRSKQIICSLLYMNFTFSVIMCLTDAMQASTGQMSQGCRTKLTERQKLWTMAHQVGGFRSIVRFTQVN